MVWFCDLCLRLILENVEKMRRSQHRPECARKKTSGSSDTGAGKKTDRNRTDKQNKPTSGRAKNTSGEAQKCNKMHLYIYILKQLATGFTTAAAGVASRAKRVGLKKRLENHQESLVKKGTAGFIRLPI